RATLVETHRRQKSSAVVHSATSPATSLSRTLGRCWCWVKDCFGTVRITLWISRYQMIDVDMWRKGKDLMMPFYGTGAGEEVEDEDDGVGEEDYEGYEEQGQFKSEEFAYDSSQEEKFQDQADGQSGY